MSVSLVIPVHGRAQLTARCLDMVLAELPDDVEVVVVDDASPDSTAELLAGYGEAIRSVRMEQNVGFARACNEGASVAAGELLVFLNNDVEPVSGWLEALRCHAADNPGAAVVGARLLYPTGAVQHAGVVFGQDGYPHHLYAGFPGDHPAVNRVRRLQAVTAACMLVRRSAFEGAGGFDSGFLNSLEDVDLCLRIGEQGGEVHYCPAAALIHFESASRGRKDRFERSVDLYRERWRDRVRRDDLDVYLGDGLLGVEYHEMHPLRITVDPRLAVVERGGDERLEQLLEGFARQTSVLLQELVRLTAETGGGVAGTAGAEGSTTCTGRGNEAFLSRVRELEEEIRRLQADAPGVEAVEPSQRLGYAYLVEHVRAAVEELVPAGAEVVVISRGDRDLLRMEGRRVGHFPQDRKGGYAGFHPADGRSAIAELERLRRQGVGYLVIPPTASWWLDHFTDFAHHLEDGYRLFGDERCRIYELGQSTADADRNTMPA